MKVKRRSSGPRRVSVALLVCAAALSGCAKPMPGALRQAGEHSAAVLFPGDFAVVCVLAPYENSAEMLPILLVSAGLSANVSIADTYVSEGEFVFVGLPSEGPGAEARTYRHSERTADGHWDSVDFEGRRCFDVARDRIVVERRNREGDLSSKVRAVDQRAARALGK